MSYSDSNFEYDQDCRPIADIQGRCRNNGKEGSYGGSGVSFGTGNPYNSVRHNDGKEDRATNNRSYFKAAGDAVEQARKAGYSGVKVQTNSKYMVDVMNEYLPTWEQNGYVKTNGKPAANQDCIRNLTERSRDMDVSYEYVPNSQRGARGDTANRLAEYGTRGPYRQY